ncbi:MAG: pyridoxamine 5'-phosphate oxidase [Pseudomonadota bacterium]
MTDQVAADFLPDSLPENPMDVVARWMDEAKQAANQPNPNAMTIATQDADGTLTARIVLCKGFDSVAGTLDFYTNYTSRKGRALSENPNVAVVFHWDHQGRQVRIEGRAEPLDDASNDRYFATRPRLSQMGAWASDQSQAIASRDALLSQFEARNATHEQQDTIPRPPHWGGYRIVASSCELWVEGSGRVHDRARYTRTTQGTGAPGAWTGERLQP